MSKRNEHPNVFFCDLTIKILLHLNAITKTEKAKFMTKLKILFQ